MGTKRNHISVSNGTEFALTSVRLPTHLVEDFKRVARAQDRSFSAQLRVVMAQHVAEQDLEEAA